MKFSTEFHNSKLAKGLVKAIDRIAPPSKLNFMDVCGTHTVNIFKFGIKSLLPQTINLISGPGCPVCVTSEEDIDSAIEICKLPDTILLTFGDMLRVPGSYSSLEKEKSKGRDIRILYSPLSALEVCKKNLAKRIVFFAIGFETTSPTIAATLIQAKQKGIKNFFIYPSHKLIPPAMKAILEGGDANIDGFICPGHVSAIIGSQAYEPVTREYDVPCVITGFEPLDILQGIYMLLRQVIRIRSSERSVGVEVQYKRCVTREGNRIAKSMLSKVFKIADAKWRGLGVIPDSGLTLRKEYEKFDIRSRPFRVVFNNGAKVPTPGRKRPAPGAKKCRCGEVLRGIINPQECRLFGKVCTPENPRGPCMVSSEGTCAAHYKYGTSVYKITQKSKVKTQS